MELNLWHHEWMKTCTERQVPPLFISSEISKVRFTLQKWQRTKEAFCKIKWHLLPKCNWPCWGERQGQEDPHLNVATHRTVGGSLHGQQSLSLISNQQSKGEKATLTPSRPRYCSLRILHVSFRRFLQSCQRPGTEGTFQQQTHPAFAVGKWRIRGSLFHLCP